MRNMYTDLYELGFLYTFVIISLFSFKLMMQSRNGKFLFDAFSIANSMFSSISFNFCNVSSWDDVKIIYRENNWKKRKFKEAARIISHNKEQMMNKKDEIKKISNLWNVVLNDKT